jgi:hypothetical protein
VRTNRDPFGVVSVDGDRARDEFSPSGAVTRRPAGSVDEQRSRRGTDHTSPGSVGWRLSVRRNDDGR